ncbi:AAC(3) family N-acetyltransferase [Actinosynnema sp. NPDC091369]
MPESWWAEIDATVRFAHAAGVIAGERADLGGRRPQRPPTDVVRRLKAMGARVPLPGAGFDCRTALPVAGYRIPAPQADNSSAATTSAGLRWEAVRDVALHDDDFAEVGAAFAWGCAVARGRVGSADIRSSGVAQAAASAVSGARSRCSSRSRRVPR